MNNATLRGSRLLTVLLVMALAIALMLGSISTASAVNVPSIIRPNAQLGVEKLLTTPNDGVWPNVTKFDFTIEAVGFTDGTATPAFDVYSMPQPSSSTLSATGFSVSAAGTEQEKLSTLATINFTKMGVYTYKITEAIPATSQQIPGLVYDVSEYYVNVYVANVIDSVTRKAVLDSAGDPLVTVSYINVFKGQNTDDPMNPTGTVTGDPTADGKQQVVDPSTAGATTTTALKAMVTMTNNYDARRLVVDKTVSGALGNPDEVFDFQVRLVKPGTTTVDTAAYSYKIYSFGDDGTMTYDGSGDDQLISTGTISGTGTITLKHNQYFVLDGLPNQEGVTVTELNATDYKTSITGQAGGVAVTPKLNLTSNKAANLLRVVEGANTLSFVNNKETVTPTGVWMNIWPYVLIAVLAVAGLGFMVASKRKNKKRQQNNGSGL